MKRILIWLVSLAACGVLRVPAAVSVGTSGSSGLWTFDTLPEVTEWATATGLQGSSSTFVSAAELDTAVQTLSVDLFTNALPTTATTPPSGNGMARYHTSGQFLQMRSVGVAATVLMATLQNDTGMDHSSLTVSYNLREASSPFVTVAEEVPGLRAYFSRVGLQGSWQLIPELSQGTPGTLLAHLNLGAWPAGASLFLLWADDNSSANTDNVGLEEGAYTIDDFSVIAGKIIFDPLAGVTILSPTPAQVFSCGATIEFSVFLTQGLGAVTNVALFDGPNFIGQTGPPPLVSPVSILCSTVAPGLHQFRAVGINFGIALTSAPVNITVIADCPSLTITVEAGVLALISWPVPSTGFGLYSASDLRAPLWEKVTQPDDVHDGFRHVAVDISGGNRFFRLEKH